ncbi:MAG: methyltransferase domain-containing protein [Spirochaetes bacterium]|nr:methyltransferase domain-containing protein [Spirochaetota bacterium]
MKIRYIMENDQEILRLELKTEEAKVIEQATRAGLSAGMRVADIGCGTGRTTAILHQIVGPKGYAVGVDGSKERIRHATERYGKEGISFALRDIRQPLEDLGLFDFIWVRFILEYFKDEAFSLVQNFAQLLKPGGILCLIDLDHNSLNHYGLSPRLEGAIRAAITQMEERLDFDPYAGRKLYSHLYRLGFHDIAVHVEAHHLIYGSLRNTDAFNWIRKIEVLAKKLEFTLPGYSSPEEFKEDFLRFFEDPGRFTYTPLIACWGRKAETSGLSVGNRS